MDGEMRLPAIGRPPSVTDFPGYDLREKSKRKQIPRSYDDTKQACLQREAHRHILHVGEEVLKKLLERCEANSREISLRVEERVCKEEAETRKLAVAAALQQAKAEEQKNLQRMRDVFDKEKQEALKVQMADLKRKAEDLVEKETQRCSNNMKKAVRKTEERWRKASNDAVEVAREQEKAAAKKLMQNKEL